MKLAIGEFAPGSTNSLWAAHQADSKVRSGQEKKNAFPTLAHDVGDLCLQVVQQVRL